jgi:DNA repair exonuclease SbcCD nuclease subunit
MSNTVEFLHIADLHLGYQQYGLKERFNDFGRAFLSAIDYAIEQSVRFVLISGDLFQKANIDPPTLLQAITGLERLRQVGIQVMAVEGNHDRLHYRDYISWLEFLAEQGYIALLSPEFQEQGIQLQPWNGSQGAYVDIEDIRVYGVPYLGASIQTVLKELPQVIAAQPKDSTCFTILMGHFGLEGEMPGAAGGVPQEAIAGLQGCVDYLALGHWHKPFERAGWIYNPGSLEACSMAERSWWGGYYHVRVDLGSNVSHKARLVPHKRRPFHQLVFAVDEFTSKEILYEKLRERLETEKQAQQPGDLSSDDKPVVEVSLEGVLAFDRSVLDLGYIDKMINDILSPLLARPKNNTRSTEFAISAEEQLPRAELERQVVCDLIRRDSRYRQQAQFWADLMVELKSMTLVKNSPETIIATLRDRMQRQRAVELPEEGGSQL